MINDLDSTLEALLRHAAPDLFGQVAISFAPPRQHVSSPFHLAARNRPVPLRRQGKSRFARRRARLASPQPAFAAWLALKALAYGRDWDSLATRPDRALSRDDGRFCFLDLPDGAYTVTAEWLSQGDRYGVASAAVARGVDGTIKFALVDLALPPTRMAGQVVIKSAPAAMARVWLKGDGVSTFTDSQGAYVLAAIEPGQRTLRAQADGFAAVDTVVTVGGRGQSANVNVALS